MSPADSLPPAYFDRVYAADADPWKFQTSDYEREKYTRSLAALPVGRFERAFEIGCSIGVLTQRLAGRCAHLLAVDVSAAALAEARRRCAAQPWVDFERMQVPGEFPDGTFDLVVVSEVGYYWSTADLACAAEKITAALAPGGALLLVHWTAPVHDYPLDGDTVHAHFLDLAQPGGPLRHVHGDRQPRYRLDLLRATPRLRKDDA